MTPSCRRALLGIALLAGASGCARISLDSQGGAETVTLPVLPHAESVKISYVRQPGEGPLSYRKNAWWLFWGALPLNHPNVARWRQDQLKPDWVAANERFKLGRPWYAWPVMLGTFGIVSLTRVEYQFDPVTVEIPRNQAADSASAAGSDGATR